MKISEKQLMIMFDVLKDSLRIAGPFGGYDPQTRLQLVHDIINQQSDTLKEVDENDKH